MISLTLEHTDNLGPEGDIPALLAKLDAKLREGPGAEEHLLVAGHALTDYVAPAEAGGWATVRAVIRAPADHAAGFRHGLLGELLALADAHFADLYQRRSIALSFELEVLGAETVLERLHLRPAPTEAL